MKYIIKARGYYDNTEFYEDYFDYVFEARNDNKAYSIADDLQLECEFKRSAAGIEQTDEDICFASCLYRIVGGELQETDYYK